VIAELAGLPGSGKTTIAKRLVLAHPGLQSVVVLPTLLTALAHPAAVARRLAGMGLPSAGGAVAGWVTLAVRAARQDRLVARAGGSLLIEEGVVHHAWRELLRHDALGRVRWPTLLASAVPLVVLAAPAGTRHARIQGKRSGGPVNRRLAAEGPGGAYWRRAEELFEEVRAAALAQRPVLQVDTSGTLEQAVQRVAELLGRLG